jgi:hypothetical protein
MLSLKVKIDFPDHAKEMCTHAIQHCAEDSYYWLVRSSHVQSKKRKKGQPFKEGIMSWKLLILFVTL